MRFLSLVLMEAEDLEEDDNDDDLWVTLQSLGFNKTLDIDEVMFSLASNKTLNMDGFGPLFRLVRKTIGPFRR